ncbi:MAG: ATP-dependent RNA helicase HrpA [Desulfobacterales bacterium]|uniref:ATP-dependent RNA helicase HrpA n=1 Tax=Candidatus Desulfatibia profunda TaxID=2841695 RepID=A0A8J6TNF8_9BACT|nr:ATP-dependent RNA helicase HrpA [Candidatus Desulfatibia profunda]MBL7179294.1 ATP-dependent RNA helicase HrpA [Desulfobacterales bacterium]
MKRTIERIEFLLPEALAADRFAAWREISRLKRSGSKAKSAVKIQKRLLGLEKQLQISMKKKAWRKDNRPEPTYNPDLPITAKKDEIINAITTNPVVIVSGETGSGKTTQIPKFCLAAGRGVDGKIGCTQPRRIAATTVSRRIAEELGEEVGRSVGFKIRFQDKTGPDGFIKIMTDGILLAETQGDPHLSAYDTIIVDEAHERSLNIDFILGFLKILIKRRNDLKLIITSATIDTEKFSKAFDHAPVIEVSGRMYPVQVRYFPADPDVEEGEEQTHIERVVRAVEMLQKESPLGDMLIFMPTEQDIRETCELIAGRNYKGITIFPLFARLSASEQSRVFSPVAARKIIVATNIAETSITIPGIKYVIDTGLARISRYTPRTRTTSLPVTTVSQSSAEQRKGRCGRVANGVCIRLFSEEDFLSRPVFTPPEILRANLAEVLLQMIALKLGDISDFPFIDRPDPKSIRDGFDLLVELGAIAPESEKKRSDGKHRYTLTKTGKLMAKLPVDPRLSRMLIEAQAQGCLQEMTLIAAALSIQDPRERPLEKTEAADRIHRAFHDPASDFITLLNIWNSYHQTWDNGKTTAQNFKQAKTYCKAHLLSFKRMREWIDIHGQLAQILKDYRFGDRRQPDSAGQDRQRGSDKYAPLYAAIHRSILSGFLANIAVKKEKNFFQAAKGREVMIFPGSTLFNRPENWIVAAEMVETSRLFARTVANIDSAWLEDLGKGLCKYTYLEPHWERNRGEVVAYEQVSLFGLIIVSRRPVSYGRISPAAATDIFIRTALVAGDVKEEFSFRRHNQSLIDDVKDMEDRIRRRDILVNEDAMFEFYQQRLQGCYDIRTLRQRIKQKGGDDFLRMQPEDIRRYLPDEAELGLFPDTIDLGNQRFVCTYSFRPGEAEDGVTAKIPLPFVSTVPAEAMDWLVPGFLREKITALIKGLPKAYRKQLVPITKTVDVIINELPKSETSLITALGKFIYRRFGVDIPAAAWSEDLLPEHLKMRIAITGPKGEELRAGRDPASFRLDVPETESSKEPSEIKAARRQWEKTGITRWDFPDLPEIITIAGKNMDKWLLYPGLEKSSLKGKRSINLRLFRHRDEAVNSHKEGVAALFADHLSKDLKFFKKSLTLPKKVEKMADYFGGAGRFETMLYDTVVQTLFCKNIRSKEAFYAHAESTAPVILASGRALLDQSVNVLEAYHETRTILYHLETSHRQSSMALQLLNTLRAELGRLVPETFVQLYDMDRFVHLVRYIKAVAIRARRALTNFEKDRDKSGEIQRFTDTLNAMLQELSPRASLEKKAALEEFFWLIEEYKVSVFAQELKTAVPVSKKRLERKVKEIERMV